MAAGKSSRINRQYKTKYRIRNWREYERGLRSRGDVTIWLSEDAIAAWIPPKNGLRGGQRRYSNLAIRTASPDGGVSGLAAQLDEPRPQGPATVQLFAWMLSRISSPGCDGLRMDISGLL